MIHYEGRWAVVTGASSGFGRGLAAGLANRGMSLVLTGRSEAGLAETARQIRRAAPQVKVEAVAADLSIQSGVSALLDHVRDRPIEVLVNNAGRVKITPFLEVMEEDWDAILTLNLKTVFFMMQSAGRHMSSGGRIVNMSSISGRSGRPG